MQLRRPDGAGGRGWGFIPIVMATGFTLQQTLLFSALPLVPWGSCTRVPSLTPHTMSPLAGPVCVRACVHDAAWAPQTGVPHEPTRKSCFLGNPFPLSLQYFPSRCELVSGGEKDRSAPCSEDPQLWR